MPQSLRGWRICPGPLGMVGAAFGGQRTVASTRMPVNVKCPSRHVSLSSETRTTSRLRSFSPEHLALSRIINPEGQFSVSRSACAFSVGMLRHPISKHGRVFTSVA